MKILLILILALFCIISLKTPTNEPYKAQPYDKAVDHLIKSASQRLAKRYDMKLVGITEGMMGCVRLIGFSFQVNGPIKKNEARKIAVDCVEDFLTEINQNEEIRPYLEVYPFDTKHVDIIIFIIEPDGRGYVHPDLSVVTAADGNIKFSTNNPENKYTYKSRESETFEDAVKILKGEIPAPASNIK